MLKDLRNSPFAKNVFVLFSGTFIAQLIPFFSLPILQKYFFEPKDFGLLTIFITFFELFSRVATLKLEFGIVLQKSTRKAINLAVGALRISLFIALGSGVLVFIFHEYLGAFYEITEASLFFLLLPLYIMISSFSEVANYWFNRKKRFKAIASAKVVQTSFAESAKVGFGLLSFGFGGLIFGRVLGYIATCVFYFIKFFQTDWRALKLVTRPQMKSTILENKNFMLFSSPSVFIGALINLSYINLFQWFYGEEIVGNLGVSMLYLGTGFGVISLSISQVFYSKLSEIENKQEMLRTYNRFAKNLGLIAIFPVVFVYLIPVNWVTYLLGEAWADLMAVAKIVVVWLAVWFVSSSLSFTFIRLGKQKELVLFDIIHLVFIPLGFFIGKQFGGVWGAIWGFTASQSIFYLLMIFQAPRFIKQSNDLR